MTISKVSPLVSTSWLRRQLRASARGMGNVPSKLRLLDTSFVPEEGRGGYREYYQQGHIGTALFFDLTKISQAKENSSAAFPIPDPNVFQEYVEELGITKDTHVVAYDRFNLRTSFRTWFLFRLFGHNKVSVLDGGLRKWISDGNHVTTEEIDVQPGKFDAKFQPHMLRDYNSMVENTKSGEEQVVDARAEKAYHEGHIPGSKSIQFASLFNKDSTMLAPPELKKLFDNAGVDLNAKVTSTCLMGLAACGLIAASHILGKEDVPLYNGSFTEWAALSSPEMTSRSES